MAKYFPASDLDVMNQTREAIVALRNTIYQQFKIDLLDTDAITALAIDQIVKQYDPNHNINFSRNGEDGKSGKVLVEHKSTRVAGPLTATGRPRKGAGTDAAFQFHAMGDLDHPRYILAAKNKDNLSIMRIYDISEKENIKIIKKHLHAGRSAWQDKNKELGKEQKRDIILLKEITLLQELTFKSESVINNCKVFQG